MSIWLTLLGMALVTYLTRAVGVLALGGEAPSWLRRWLGHVPVAVFVALVAPALLIRDTAGIPTLSVGAPLLAGLVGAVVAWRNGGVVLTILAGLITFWVLRWLG
ncbi:MAG: hypothetical protein Fur005_15560 [Roseiflexaceae bacterium]